MNLDVTRYELRWPSELFASEGRRILQPGNPTWEERATWLMTEALVGATAVTDFRELPSAPNHDDDPWTLAVSPPMETDGSTRRDWFTELVSRAAQLPSAATPSPYWPQRQGRGFSQDRSTLRDTRRGFARVIGELADNGYLAEVFGQECIDGSGESPDPSVVIEDRLGIARLWPLQPETWDEDTFFGLIEVFHDLVSRPRARHFHDHDDCGWHYSEFHDDPARILYRWRVNRLLRETATGHELAAEGEDLGRLVAVTDDARSDLMHRALAENTPDIAVRTRHAIALFRARDTTAESKRSAIVTLAGILEERRTLIKNQVGKPDEGALFEVANRFDLRHRRADQRGDYDEAFLDWIFWWYLATVELTNNLIRPRG